MASWSGWQRAVAIISGCTCLCLAFLLTAQTRSALPTGVAATVVGGLVLLLPLRHFDSRKVSMGLGWLIGSVAVALLAPPAAASARPAASAVLLGTTAALWLIFFGRTAARMAAERPPSVIPRQRGGQPSTLEGRRIVGAWLATVLAAIGAALVIRESGRVFHTPHWLAGIATVAIVGLAAGWLLIAVGGAVVRTIDGIPDGWTGPFRRPRRPDRLPPNRLKRRTYADRTDPLTLIGRELTRLIDVTIFVVGRVAIATGEALRLLWYWLRRAVVAMLNWLCRCGREGWILVMTAVRMIPRCATRAIRIAVLPTIGLAAAAVAVAGFAANTETYLATGRLIPLAALLGLALAGLAALTLAWTAVCDLAWGKARRSAGRSATRGGAFAVLITAFGGWAMGLFGAFGNGPIHIGYLTLTSTVAIVAMAIWIRIRPDTDTAA